MELYFNAGSLWTMAVAVCCSVACATIGSFLVLRRMSLLGDAISHSILPGLAMAFIVTGTREPWAMLAGAMAVGVLTAGLATGVRRLGRLPEDAALGVVFSSLFALGVILITFVADRVDLDPMCVLYGLLETVSLDTVEWFGVELPRALPWQMGLMLGNIALIVLLFKELRITTFDPGLATTLGISAGVVQFILMSAVAATTVISFEAVGSILVVAMLVAPGATAQMLTDRLGGMVILSGVFGATAAALGCLGAIYWNTSTAGMISVVAGGQFAAAAIFGPRYGVLARAVRHQLLSLRIAREDALGLLYRVQEAEGGTAALPASQVARSLGSRARSRLALAQLRRGGLVETAGGELRLTDCGEREAARVIRAHRLWESFLSQNLPLPLDHLHDPSERLEHFISPEMQGRIAAEVGGEADPHGKTIPSPTAPPAPRGE